MHFVPILAIKDRYIIVYLFESKVTLHYSFFQNGVILGGQTAGRGETLTKEVDHPQKIRQSLNGKEKKTLKRNQEVKVKLLRIPIKNYFSYRSKLFILLSNELIAFLGFCFVSTNQPY